MTAVLKIKNDRFYAVINYKENGKYKQKWVTTGYKVKNNKRKAEEKLLEIKREFEERFSEESTSSCDISFTSYVKSWLAEKRGTVEQSTWEGYEIYSLKHIIPYFEEKGILLKDVKPRDIQEYYYHKYSDGGRLDGKSGGLSIPSIKKHAIVLKEVLDAAVMEELILRNPAVGVKLPAKNVPRRDKTFLTLSEANDMLKAFAGERLQPLVYVTLYYGLRRSEAIGLRWSAVDFEAGTITINHTIVKNLTTEAKDRTKTESSYHTYKLIDDVRDVLLRQKEWQRMNAAALGREYRDSGYVFTWENGEVFKPDYVTRAFQKVLKRRGLKMMRFHDLRHSTASILHEMGWDIKDIQTWLRHSSVEVTADIYTHISEEKEGRMADEFNASLSLT